MEWKKEWLRGLAFGARPYMEINWKRNPEIGAIGENYQICLERIAEPYRICYHDLKYQTLFIDKLQEPVPGVYYTTYENGLSIAVNTTDVPFENMAPLSWKKISSL